MKKAIILSILLLLTAPALASKVLIEIPIRWEGEWLIKDLPSASCFHDSEDDESDCLKGRDGEDQAFGGFSGFYSGSDPALITLKMARDGKLPSVHVYIWTTDDKLIWMSKKKKGDGHYKYRIAPGGLRSDKARNKKNDLPADNNGD